MAIKLKKLHNQNLRKKRVRAKVTGTSERPRLALHLSLKNVNAQIIDDSKGKTLVSSTSLKAPATAKTMAQKVEWVAEDIAKKAKVKKVVFDKSHKQYHGKVKLFADTARKSGLEF